MAYGVIELDQDPRGIRMHEELIKEYGQKTVPYVFIKGQLIGGNSDLQLIVKKDQLDQMLI